ncbi:MAG: radical SAM protein [Candidatus Gracilibacteria bacterium]|nr:radical SAM protein [Candidatus Gracilibacteria bacterium]
MQKNKNNIAILFEEINNLNKDFCIPKIRQIINSIKVDNNTELSIFFIQKINECLKEQINNKTNLELVFQQYFEIINMLENNNFPLIKQFKNIFIKNNINKISPFLLNSYVPYFDKSEQNKNNFFKESGVPISISHYDNVFRYLIKNYFGNEKVKILEIGCYTGMFLDFLKKDHFTYLIGIDKNNNSIDFSRKYLDFVYNIDITNKNDICSLKKFDFILLVNVLHQEIKEPDLNSYLELFFSNCLLLLNNNGEIFFNHEKNNKEFFDIFQNIISKFDLTVSYLITTESDSTKYCIVKRKVNNKIEIQRKNTSLNVPTNFYCNQKCVFCIDFCIDKEKHLFSYLEKPNIINETYTFLEQNSGIYEKVMFTFGEPTLNPSLPLYIKKAKELGYKEIGIVTNGSKLSDNKLRKEIIEAGLDLIIFSIHGSNSTIHDYLTQVKGSFDKTLKGLILCKKEYKNLDIKVSYVLNKYNLKDLLPAIKLFKKVGVSNIIINTIRPNLNEDDPHYYDNVYDFSDFLTYINSLRNDDIKFLNSLIKERKLNFTDIPICILQKTKLDLFSYGKVEIRVVKQLDDNAGFHNTENEKIYLDICGNCEFKSDCEGLYKKYLNIFSIENFKNIFNN